VLLEGLTLSVYLVSQRLLGEPIPPTAELKSNRVTECVLATDLTVATRI